jgi:curved DNA-binding protein CbpA
MPDPYEALQVDRRAEPEVIAAAYRSLARKYHPDKNASAASTKRMQELNAAYEILRDPDAMEWGAASDPNEATDWASSYARRRSHPAPIPRKGFWERNWDWIVYLAFFSFVVWQVVATIIVKM